MTLTILAHNQHLINRLINQKLCQQFKSIILKFASRKYDLRSHQLYSLDIQYFSLLIRFDLNCTMTSDRDFLDIQSNTYLLTNKVAWPLRV